MVSRTPLAGRAGAATALAHFLSKACASVSNQGLGAAFRRLSTDHPQHCPAPVWKVAGAGRALPAQNLGSMRFTLRNQGLGLVVRTLSTTGPQSCPGRVWIRIASGAPPGSARFFGSAAESLCDQWLSASIRCVSTSGPQHCPAPVWKAAPAALRVRHNGPCERLAAR